MFRLSAAKISKWVDRVRLSLMIVLCALQGIQVVTLSIPGFIRGTASLRLPFAFDRIGAGDVKYLGVFGATRRGSVAEHDLLFRAGGGLDSW
jgi:Flp pilus assembly protein protease CpaA